MEEQLEQDEMLKAMEGMVSTLNLELHKCKQDHKKEILKIKDELAN